MVDLAFIQQRLKMLETLLKKSKKKLIKFRERTETVRRGTKATRRRRQINGDGALGEFGGQQRQEAH